MAECRSVRASTLRKRVAPTDTKLPPSKRLPPPEHNSATATQSEIVAMRVENMDLTKRIEQLHRDNTALTTRQERLVTESSTERAMLERKVQEAEESIARIEAVLQERIQSLSTELETNKRARSTDAQVAISGGAERERVHAQVKKDLVKLEDKLHAQQQRFESEKCSMQEEILELQAALNSKEKQGIKAVQKEMEKLEVSSAQRTEDLKTEIKILRDYNANLEQDRAILEQELQAAQQEVCNAQAKISAMEEDLDEQEQLYKAAIKAKEVLIRQQPVPHDDAREKAELKRNIQILTDERDEPAKKLKGSSGDSSSIAIWQGAAKANKSAAKKSNERVREALKTQRDLEIQLQQRTAEIAELRRRPPKKSSKQSVKDAEKQADVAVEAQKAAEIRVENLFQHYDVLHGKNLVLVSKLTAMAQVGGFGNHGSIYRKELDALKGLPLGELDEYKACS